MMKTLRGLVSGSALALLITASPALAAGVIDVTGTNGTTGADSINTNTHDIHNNVNSTLHNNGHVNNVANASTTTGYNEQEKNTTAGDLTSGGVDATTDWNSMLNSGAALVGGDNGLNVSAGFTNDITGFDSTNRNDLNVHNDINSSLTNSANVLSSLGLNANTGHNEQEKNTTAGNVQTGGVSVDSAISNNANNNSGMGTALGGQLTVDTTAGNHMTGADSSNRNTVDVHNNIDSRIVNEANLTSNVNVTADTGHNTQNKNTTAGDLKTGSVDVSTAITNNANNGSGTGNVGNQDVSVSADLSNNTTGHDSTNTNTVDVHHDVTTTVSNTATVDNNLSVNANTGHNEQSQNTQGGSIGTGDVSINFSSNSTVNSN